MLHVSKYHLVYLTYTYLLFVKKGLPWWHSKEPACNTGDSASIPGLGRYSGEGNGIQSSILAWRIPWTEEPSGLQFMGSQRVGHDWVTELKWIVSICRKSTWLQVGKRHNQGTTPTPSRGNMRFSTPSLALENWAVHTTLGLPRCHSGKESACPCRRHKRLGFSPWVRKIPWRKK